MAGRLADAQNQASQAFELSQHQGEQGHGAYALRLLGSIAARRKPPAWEIAATHYRQALDRAEALGMRPLAAHCHLGLGTVHFNTGLMEQAHAELATAVELYRSMEMAVWLPDAEKALAELEAR